MIKAGIPEDQRPNHKYRGERPIAPKLPLSVRQQRLRDKNYLRKKQVPARLATNDLKVERLFTIRDKMRLSLLDFAAMLNITTDQLTRVLYKRGECPMIYVALAEEKLKRFLSKKRRQESKRQRKLHDNPLSKMLPVPDTVKANRQLKVRIMVLQSRGLSSAEIARQLQVKREYVEFFVGQLETED